MDAQNKFIELKDICDKAFKRNNIYPLMEIPKPDSKGIIEEALNDIYLKSIKAKEQIKKERIAYNKMLLNSLSVIIHIESYDMMIIKSIL